MQCSICSQLSNKPNIVVTDFRLHHTCSIVILGVRMRVRMRIMPRARYWKNSMNNQVKGVDVEVIKVI